MRAIPAIVASLCVVVAAGPEEKLPILKATRPVVSIREGDTLRRDSWTLAPEVKPDVYEADLPEGRPRRVTFLTDVDSISFDVAEGRQYDFIIQHGSDLCLTRIVGSRAVPAAVFDQKYREEHKGRISVEVPEVYELVNIALAMTPTGIADRNLVYHGSPYYSDMREWFDPFKEHPVLAALDSTLRRSPALYSNLKMNGYSFEFDREDRIVQSKIYDRTSFISERRNSLRPFIAGLQSFAAASKFRDFYKRNRDIYASQIAFYRDTVEVDAMRGWLKRNFPKSAGYDTYKVLFSPLVAYSQSATWLESNGFKELQAHVNFPYPEDTRRRTQGSALSTRAETALRGAIVFTELNHGYINPEADRHAGRILAATSRREHWVDPAKGPNYYGGISAFNEYMNWALVSLYVVDTVPEKEQGTLIAIVDDMMTRSRGFPQFAAFDRFLVGRYRGREAGQTVADLYPRIIAWFEAQNAAPASGPGGR